MLVAGLVLMVVAGCLAGLEFFGLTPGAAGVVTLMLVVSFALLVCGGIRASLRSHHLKHAHD